VPYNALGFDIARSDSLNLKSLGAIWDSRMEQGEPNNAYLSSISQDVSRVAGVEPRPKRGALKELRDPVRDSTLSELETSGG